MNDEDYGVDGVDIEYNEAKKLQDRLDRLKKGNKMNIMATLDKILCNMHKECGETLIPCKDILAKTKTAILAEIVKGLPDVEILPEEQGIVVSICSKEQEARDWRNYRNGYFNGQSRMKARIKTSLQRPDTGKQGDK